MTFHFQLNLAQSLYSLFQLGNFLLRKLHGLLLVRDLLLALDHSIQA